MAIDTAGNALDGESQAVHTGSHRSILTDKATYLLRTGQGKLAQIVVTNVGTTWTIDIYDAVTAASGKKIWEWVTADGKGTFAVQIPCSTGITVVSGGTTAGLAVVVWD
jgi:hypothetical protein